jgi:Calx-beta domain
VGVSGATSSTFCAPGTFSAVAGAVACDPAPVDHYVDVAGATAPTPCPVGSHQPSTGQTACIFNTSSLTVHDAPAVEAPSKGKVYASFEISLDVASAGPVSVTVETLGGTAKQGKDFGKVSTVITFDSGETTKTVLVAVKKSNTTGPPTTFSLVLSNAVGATIADGTGIGTITYP